MPPRSPRAEPRRQACAGPAAGSPSPVHGGRCRLRRRMGAATHTGRRLPPPSVTLTRATFPRVAREGPDCSFARKNLSRDRSLRPVSPHLSPHLPPALFSPHRCTEARLQTSSWCSEAGWQERRFQPGPGHRVPRRSDPASGPRSAAWPVPVMRGQTHGRSFPWAMAKDRHARVKLRRKLMFGPKTPVAWRGSGLTSHADYRSEVGASPCFASTAKRSNRSGGAI